MCKIEIFQFIHEIILQCVSENGMGLSRSGTLVLERLGIRGQQGHLYCLFLKENVIQDKMYGRYLVHIHWILNKM